MSRETNIAAPAGAAPGSAAAGSYPARRRLSSGFETKNRRIQKDGTEGQTRLFRATHPPARGAHCSEGCSGPKQRVMPDA